MELLHVNKGILFLLLLLLQLVSSSGHISRWTWINRFQLKSSSAPLVRVLEENI